MNENEGGKHNQGKKIGLHFHFILFEFFHFKFFIFLFYFLIYYFFILRFDENVARKAVAQKYSHSRNPNCKPTIQAEPIYNMKDQVNSEFEKIQSIRAYFKFENVKN